MPCVTYTGVELLALLSIGLIVMFAKVGNKVKKNNELPIVVIVFVVVMVTVKCSFQLHCIVSQNAFQSSALFLLYQVRVL